MDPFDVWEGPAQLFHLHRPLRLRDLAHGGIPWRLFRRLNPQDGGKRDLYDAETPSGELLAHGCLVACRLCCDGGQAAYVRKREVDGEETRKARVQLIRRPYAGQDEVIPRRLDRGSEMRGEPVVVASMFEGDGDEQGLVHPLGHGRRERVPGLIPSDADGGDRRSLAALQDESHFQGVLVPLVRDVRDFVFREASAICRDHEFLDNIRDLPQNHGDLHGLRASEKTQAFGDHVGDLSHPEPTIETRALDRVLEAWYLQRT